jgi:hypothetical protein
LEILNAIDGSTVLPSLIFACNTNGHVPATNVLENGIELLKNHWPSLPAVRNIWNKMLDVYLHSN